MAKNKAYVVLIGRQTGVFTDWEVCKKQVEGFPKAKYKGFSTLELAHEAFKHHTLDVEDLPLESLARGVEEIPEGQIPMRLPHHFISADAAYSHKTKQLEYRVVEVKGATQHEVHRSPAYQGGSANTGEFMAILDACVYMGRNNLTAIPLYSDSHIAQGWVAKKSGNSKVTMSDELKEAYLARVNALKEGKYDKLLDTIEILDWKTKEWGIEIPADFGRK